MNTKNTDKSSFTEYKWVQQVFYLEKGRTIEVALAETSLKGKKTPNGIQTKRVQAEP